MQVKMCRLFFFSSQHTHAHTQTCSHKILLLHLFCNCPIIPINNNVLMYLLLWLFIIPPCVRQHDINVFSFSRLNHDNERWFVKVNSQLTENTNMQCTCKACKAFFLCKLSRQQSDSENDET